MKYCTTCEQNVNHTKKFSFGWFILNCLWIIGGGVYIIYWIALKKGTCPICKGHPLKVKREAIDRENDMPIQSALSTPIQRTYNSNQFANDVHKRKLSMRQQLLQQRLKSVEHCQELKDVAEFQVRCEVATAARMLAVEQRKLEKKQKRAARMRVYHLSEKTIEQGI